MYDTDGSNVMNVFNASSLSDSETLKEKRFSLSEESALTLVSKCLSGRRLEILRSIARKPQSLGEIAKDARVHRGFLTETVNLLQSQQIVRIVRNGRRKVPELVIDRLVINLQEGR
jgi:predicted transcriptional regulator